MWRPVALRNELAHVNQQFISEFQSILRPDFVGDKCKEAGISPIPLPTASLSVRILPD